MKIEFSPSQLPAPGAASPVKGASAPPAANELPALQGMAELQRKLNDLALTRPDKMEAAKAVIAEVNYPPEELLNGIARLLAIHLRD